ncbi:MAG: aminomethyl-transferring glycine dehydrogenase [Cytophagaceae bacterium]|jgi:glycine dehydrogenase|nr:aminomethyl-transferring glycine dehydrogenase [Cytophagaceae bacterium]
MTDNSFVYRHIGPRNEDVEYMLNKMGLNSLDELIDQTVPKAIRMSQPLNISAGLAEDKFLVRIRELAAKNKVFKTYIGMGYYNTHTPAVIIRNVLENPVWYTSYTPYQAEISQGRLEALLNYQTMVADLTAMNIANASLLDEGTAAAEAMIMMFNTRSRSQEKEGVNKCLVDEAMWQQTKAVIETRALPLGIEIEYASFGTMKFDPKRHFGIILQYPDANGEVNDYRKLTERVHEAGGKVAVATDLLALTQLAPPGEWDADIVLGSSQRFGLPMAYGGAHAGFFAVKDEYKRNLPGRIIGITRDANGKPALRMALQTREQHIKREKATSNICTAQALMAMMSGFYGVYHGADGVSAIGKRVHNLTARLAAALEKLEINRTNKYFFDTLRLTLPASMDTAKLQAAFLNEKMNLLYLNGNKIGISIDETTTLKDLETIVAVFAKVAGKATPEILCCTDVQMPQALLRTSAFMQQDVFKKYRSETEMMRYIKRLERKDISLTHSMISLGSCTMKLNAAAEMFPITWGEFAGLHPFIPVNQAEGYHEMMNELRNDLAVITGFAGVSLQPNSGAAGEYAGLMVIRAYLDSRGETHRNVALIPASAHGTNPASAVMAGLKIVIVKCDEKGNIDVADLKEKAEQYRDNLACLIVTYPSTHGVFESSIIDICKITHANGGQVYMDGANMNAQVGLTSPGFIGADVCHLNLHKTFASPHGGGGPGVGPICVAKHLVELLPGHPVIDNRRPEQMTVSSAPYGSAGILPITYGYIKMMGGEGLTLATKMAILNANYLAHELKDDYGIVFTGENGRVAHEMILECRNFKNVSGVTESDIAKRLMDYGFHAPTLSFPVHGTLMVEPTESESLAELDRFVATMKNIRSEITEIETGKADREDNVLKNAPHPQYAIVTDDWQHSYGREKAAFPMDHVRENKFWINVSRVDDAYGDRNLVCICDSLR